MNNSSSLLQGKTWYWRQGLARTPYGADALIVWELALPTNGEDTDEILSELNDNGIWPKAKVTHSSDQYIPKKATIIYMAAGDVKRYSEEERDNNPEIQKLKQYILSNNGLIHKEEHKKALPIRSLFSFLKRKKR